jgi:hypothetical protein
MRRNRSLTHLQGLDQTMALIPSRREVYIVDLTKSTIRPRIHINQVEEKQGSQRGNVWVFDEVRS